MAVFRVGGIDAVLDIFNAVMGTVAALVSPANIVAFIVTGPLIAYSTQHLQSANHCLVYNVEIREMISCIMGRKKHSKVIILQRE